jgi:hypothetical protein
MVYLKNAPKTLIELYEHRLRTDGTLIDGSFVPLVKYRPRHNDQFPLSPLRLLEELLCHSRMKRAWNILRKSVRSEDDYKKLFRAIIESMGIARRGIVSQTDRKEKYEDIAKRAEKLAQLITELKYMPGTGLPYTGDLDLQAYELLPEDVASILGAQSWATMKSDERSDWAYSILRAWPTMVELLEQLAIRARRQGSEYVSSGRRSRGLGEALQEEKAANTKARLFSCHLYDHLRKMDEKFTGFAAIKAIVLIAYNVDVDRKTLRKWIVDHFQKTTTYEGGKIYR